MEYENQLCHDNCENVLLELPNDSIDLVVTDVPYGISYNSNKQNYNTRDAHNPQYIGEKYFEKISNDDSLPVDWLYDIYKKLKENSAIYIFIHWSQWPLLYFSVRDAGFSVKNMIVLNKSNHGMGDLKGSFAPKHELLMFATKGRHILNFPYKRFPDVWEVPVLYSGARRLHPNQKPSEWITPCIECSSQESDLVFDPFMGSGMIPSVSKKLNRKFLGVELDKEYYNIACDLVNKTKIENEIF